MALIVDGVVSAEGSEQPVTSLKSTSALLSVSCIASLLASTRRRTMSPPLGPTQ